MPSTLEQSNWTLGHLQKLQVQPLCHCKPDGTSSHQKNKKGPGNKMVSNSIASELLKSFSDGNYQKYTQALSNHDGVDIGEFP